jgi:phosphoglycerate kinase
LFTKKTVRDVDLAGKTVLLRADYNVPLEKGAITDDYRIKQSLPTIQYILDQPGSKLIICSHLGRPKSPDDKQFSLAPVAKRLGQLLGKPVAFAADCIGESAKQTAAALAPGGILMLENVRFHPEEEKNDTSFGKAIIEATGVQIFVQDGFGVVHRAHATTEAIAKQLPSVAGLLLEKEVDTITNVMQNPKRPLVAVIGGAKISDKIDILNRFVEIADCVAVAGAMGNNFLLAEGFSMGQSLVEPGVLDTAKEILERARAAERERNFNFLLPIDVVVSTNRDGSQPTRVVDLASHTLSDINAYPKKPDPASYTIGADEMMLDIGPISAAYIAGAVRLAQTVVWNGAAGVTETKGMAGASAPFSHGTRMIVDAMIGSSNNHMNKPFSLVGGGDTVGYVESEGLLEDFNHVSTGGGASLDLMAGKNLPGVDVLLSKDG